MGCREIIKENDQDNHERNCIFRKVHCPHIYCHETINFQEIFDHLNHESHQKPKYLQNIGKNEFEMIVDLSRTSYDENDWGQYWIPRLFSFQDQKFCFTGDVCNDITYYWIYFYGSECELRQALFQCKSLLLNNMHSNYTINQHFSIIRI